jgi:hypothetical protein
MGTSINEILMTQQQILLMAAWLISTNFLPKEWLVRGQ